MKKISVKLLLSFIAFLAVNLWLMFKGAAKGSADFFISPKVEETILFFFLQKYHCHIWQYLREFLIFN